MHRYLVTFTLAAIVTTTASCGNKTSPNADQQTGTTSSMTGMGNLAAGTFAPEWLTSYSTWTPVIAGDKALNSSGHGGIWVHSYLNDKATERAKAASNPLPMPEGSVLAKAVVPSENSDVKADVTRVYFMKKEKTGYDLEHGNWSYAVATVVNGQLKYDTSVGPKQSACISCHAKFSEYDYVKTVDIYREGLGK